MWSEESVALRGGVSPTHGGYSTVAAAGSRRQSHCLRDPDRHQHRGPNASKRAAAGAAAVAWTLRLTLLVLLLALVRDCGEVVVHQRSAG